MVTNVTIGSNITTIGKNAFSGATKLKTISIGKNVTKIGVNAFKGLTKATTIKVPKKMLSAFCGAVSASCAAATAITYLCGGTLEQIKATIDNTLANIPGIICDGAKVSCASKIASSLDAAMMAHNLAMNGKAYEAYTGIIKEDAAETISCVGYIGKVGMIETDKEIIKMMLQS